METEKNDIEKLKVELEVEKLRRDLNKVGWDLKFQTKDIFSLAVAILGLYLAVKSGIFDAKKTQLDAQNLMLEAKNERFKTESILAVERNRKIEEQSTILEANLKELQNEMNRYRLTESDLIRLQKSGDIAINYDLMMNRFSIRIEKYAGIPLAGPGKSKQQLDRLGEILSILGRIKLPAPIESVEIFNTPVTAEDLASLGNANVEFLRLGNTDTTDESLRSLATFVGLKQLILIDQKLGKLTSLAQLPNLTHLDLSDAGVNPGEFDQQLNCSKKLEFLFIRDKNFDDASVNWLYQFDRLVRLTLFGTNVTTEGLRRIAERTNAEIVFAPFCKESEIERIMSEVQKIQQELNLNELRIQFAPKSNFPEFLSP